MNCEDAQYYLPLYWTAELDPGATVELERHLARCPDCAREAARQRQFDDVLRRAFAELEPDTRALRASIHRDLDRSRSPWHRLLGWRLPRWAILLGGVTGILLGIGLGYWAWEPAADDLYGIAARHHFKELILQEPKPWVVSRDEIDALAREHVGETVLLDQLAPPESRLARARYCRLEGAGYLHLVYAREQREVSVLVRPRGSIALPGKPSERIEGRPLFLAASDDLQVAAFETPTHTILVISQLRRNDHIRLARELSQRAAHGANSATATRRD